MTINYRENTVIQISDLSFVQLTIKKENQLFFHPFIIKGR